MCETRWIGVGITTTDNYKIMHSGRENHHRGEPLLWIWKSQNT